MTSGRGRRLLTTRRLLVVAVAVGALAGAFLVLGRSHEGSTATARPGSSSAPSAPAAKKRSAAHSTAIRREMAVVRARLAQGVARARTLGGRVQAAVWLDGWPAPIVVGDDAGTPMRMWSMAKPVEAIAAIRLARRDRLRLTAAFAPAMQRALRRSENCAARRMVLELQQLSGGPSGARVAFGAVLRDAGAHPVVASEEDGDSDQSAECRAALEREASGLVAPDGDAVLFGTSLWTVADAVRFAHALADGRYGSAGGAVLATMAKPKEPSQEQGAVFTAGLRWGAGVGFRGYPVAYKAGWGGARQGAFLAGQIAVVDLNGRRAAVTAMFHPGTQPRIDDPGETSAPRALEDIFSAVAAALP